MDRIKDLLAKLGTLNEAETVELRTLLTTLGGYSTEQLDALDADLSKAFEADGVDVANLRLLGEGIKNVFTAQSAIKTAAETAAKDAADAKALREEVAALKTPTPEATPEAPAVVETPAAEVVEAPAAAAEVPAVPEPVAASAPSLSTVREHAPSTTAPRDGGSEQQTIVAAGGRQLTSAKDLAEVMTEAILSSASIGEQGVKVASILSNVTDDARMTNGGRTSSQEKIDALVAAAQTPDAFTASGGVCAPLAPRYDLFNVSDARRPIRDALVQFDASRGGATYTTPAKISDLASAVTVWTEANDRSPSSPATKPRLHIACGAAQTVYTAAIPLRLGFGNMEARAYPELVQQNTALGLAYQARVAELQLLTIIDAASSARTSGAVISATRDLLFAMNQQAAAFRVRHRMPVDASLDVILPQWFLALVRSDLTRQLPGDGVIAVADAEIMGYLAAAHLRPIWSADAQYNDTKFLTGPAAGVAATAITGFPTTVTWRMFPTGSFVFLDGGKLDLGVIRDSTLNNTNDYEMFVETFENVAFVGVEALTVTTTIVPNGTTVGATAPAGVTAASA